MRKVFDCFTFFNELDLLEIRLNELNDVVDYFVIVEGNKTFQNNPKPNYYLENIDRFKKFTSKIIRIEIPGDKFSDNAWDNERISWNSIIKGLHIAKEDDIIIISALDEIPKNESISHIIQKSTFPVCVNTKMFYFYLNTQYSLQESNGGWNANWRGSYVTTYNLLNKDNPYCFVDERKHIPLVGEGWHYSFLGDSKNAFNKVHSYSHSECNHFTEEFYKQQIQDLKDVFGRSDVKFGGFESIENFPQYVQDNLEKFSNYIRK